MYSHTQYQPIGTYVYSGAMVAIFASLLLLYSQAVARFFGTPSYVEWTLLGFIFVLYCLQTFVSLTVMVDDHTIVLRYKAFWTMGMNTMKITRADRPEPVIPLADVVSASSIRPVVRQLSIGLAPLGIFRRLNGKLTVYNLLNKTYVWQFPGWNFTYVEIVRRDGTKVLIPTDDPQGLARAITERIQPGVSLLIDSDANYNRKFGVR